MALKRNRGPIYLQVLSDVLTPEEILIYKTFINFRNNDNGELNYKLFAVDLGEDYSNLISKLRTIRKKIENYHELIDMSVFKFLDPNLNLYIEDEQILLKLNNTRKKINNNKFLEIINILNQRKDWIDLIEHMDIQSALIVFLNSINIENDIIAGFLNIPCYEVERVLHLEMISQNKTKTVL